MGHQRAAIRAVCGAIVASDYGRVTVGSRGAAVPPCVPLVCLFSPPLFVAINVGAQLFICVDSEIIVLGRRGIRRVQSAGTSILDAVKSRRTGRHSDALAVWR